MEFKKLHLGTISYGSDSFSDINKLLCDAVFGHNCNFISSH